MKAPFNSNLPYQTGDVIVNPINPENPDSKPLAAARTRLNCTYKSLVLNQDFEDYKGRLRFESKVYS